MTNTEAYKARIEAAGSRDALQAIETEVRKDRGLTFGEKEAILRACEGRDYILRNRAEAWAVMNILFFRVKAEMDAYRDLSGAPQSWTPDEIAEQRTRFISLWQVIEEAELAGWLQSVVEDELVPLLEEYWFDEPSKADQWAIALRAAIE